MKKIIETLECSNLKELQEAIDTLVALSGNRDAETIYLEDGTGMNVTLRLIETVLSDRSTTYDVRLS
jgi:hypothetical protein